MPPCLFKFFLFLIFLGFFFPGDEERKLLFIETAMAVKSPDGHRMTPVILPRSVVSDKGMTCEAVGALASPWQCAARGAGARQN